MKKFVEVSLEPLRPRGWQCDAHSAIVHTLVFLSYCLYIVILVNYLTKFLSFLKKFTSHMTIPILDVTIFGYECGLLWIIRVYLLQNLRCQKETTLWIYLSVTIAHMTRAIRIAKPITWLNITDTNPYTLQPTSNITPAELHCDPPAQ